MANSVTIKRSRLRPRSKKREKLDAIYYEKRREFLALNPDCHICGGIATDVHHTARRGANYLNVLSWLPLCRSCHAKVESNGKWARENGYLV